MQFAAIFSKNHNKILILILSIEDDHENTYETVGDTSFR